MTAAPGSMRETTACVEVGSALGYVGALDAEVVDRMCKITGTLVRLARGVTLHRSAESVDDLGLVDVGLTGLDRKKHSPASLGLWIVSKQQVTVSIVVATGPGDLLLFLGGDLDAVNLVNYPRLELQRLASERSGILGVCWLSANAVRNARKASIHTPLVQVVALRRVRILGLILGLEKPLVAL